MTWEEVAIGTCRLLCGDALDVLPTLAENSIDACVTDPPYGLEFMGQKWDAFGRTRSYTPRTEQGHANSGMLPMYGRGGTSEQRDAFKRKSNHAFEEWSSRWAAAVFRTLKPGAHLVAFGGTRTHHRLMCALEDAGFELRDTLMFLHAQGFPKSLDVSKALDKAAGAEREVVGDGPYASKRPHSDHTLQGITFADDSYVRPPGDKLTAPTTDAAKQYMGYGTALKPAWEPIILARKPLQGNVAENVLRWGTGVLNIDGCRIAGAEPHHNYGRTSGETSMVGKSTAPSITPSLGRWPANVVHDGSAVALAGFPDLGKASNPHGSVSWSHGKGTTGHERWKRSAHSQYEPTTSPGYGDTGSAARFFYAAKASPSERGPGNTHPTVKPVSLMRWLVRLVTPPQGTVLDPFAGSGTTGIAAYEEGRACLLIEREREYFAIAQQRLTAATTQLTLFAPTIQPVPNKEKL